MAEDFQAKYERQWAELNEADAAAKAVGRLVGRYITHPHADGQAVYRITSEAPRGRVVIEVVEIGDGWVLPAWGQRKALARKQVMEFLHRRDGMEALFTRNTDWWANQPVGKVVHYANGSGQYIRGVIVDADGERRMRPTALVGNWQSYDLPRRMPDGSVYLGHYAKQIADGEPMQPHASSVVESPEHTLREGEPHPSTLPELDLTVPPMTAAEQELARAYNLRERVLGILNYQGAGDGSVDLNDPVAHGLRQRVLGILDYQGAGVGRVDLNDPVAHAKAIKAALARVLTLLEAAEGES